jgi:hypothetical protein
MIRPLRILSVLALAGLFGSVSCSDDPAEPGDQDHGETTAECDVIGELCHGADDGDGPIAACHDVGHAGDAEECAAQFDECVDLCLDASEPGDDDEDPYCRALGELCHAADDGDGPIAECHEVGHSGDAHECADHFDDCAELCLGAEDDHEGSGGTGAGGGSALGGAGGGS